MLEENEVIEKIARHFNYEIKYFITERGIKKCEQLIELWDEFGNIGATNTGYSDGDKWKGKGNVKPEYQNKNENTWRSLNQGGNNNSKNTYNSKNNNSSFQQNGENTKNGNNYSGPDSAKVRREQRGQTQGNSLRQSQAQTPTIQILPDESIKKKLQRPADWSREIHSGGKLNNPTFTRKYKRHRRESTSRRNHIARNREKSQWKSRFESRN